MKRAYGKRKQVEAEPPVTPSKPSKRDAQDRSPGRKPSAANSTRPLSRSHTEPSMSSLKPSLTQTPTRTRTYAGTSRSFLVELPLSVEETHSPEVPRESYTALRAKWGLDNEVDEGDPSPSESESLTPRKRSKTSSPVKGLSKPSRTSSINSMVPTPPILANGMMNDLKSITDLRSKGQSRRFLDEVGYMFEGMHPSCAPGLRRASALELVQKLCDRDFSRKARAADFHGRALDVFCEAGAGRGDDKVLDTFLLAFLALVAREPDALMDLATRSVVVPSDTTAKAKSAPLNIPLMLLNSLSSSPPTEATPQASQFFSPDIIATVISPDSSSELKRAGISKSEKASLISLHDCLVTRSGIFASGVQLSSALLCSYVLRVLTSLEGHPFFLPSVDHPQNLSYPSLVLRVCKAALIPFGTVLSSSNNQPRGDTGPSTPSLNQFMHANNCLHILDAVLQGQWEEANPENTDPSGLSDGLLALAAMSEIVLAQSLPDDRDTEDHEIEAGLTEILHSQALECTELVLRVLMRFTQGERGEKSAKGKEKMKARELQWTNLLAAHEFALPHVMRTIVKAHTEMCLGARTPVPETRSGLRGRTIKIEESGDTQEARKAETQFDSHDDLQQRAEALDRLCLALALLTNIVHGADASASSSLHNLRLSRTCTLTVPCLKSCACCENTLGALEVLSEIYACHLEPHTEAKEEPTTSEREPRALSGSSPGDPAAFLSGHLAIVFGMLMHGSEIMRQSIMKQLAPLVADSADDHERDSTIIRQLIAQGQQFIAFYKTLLGASGTEADPLSSPTHDGDGVSPVDDVAAEVIGRLERLLETCSN